MKSATILLLCGLVGVSTPIVPASLPTKPSPVIAGYLGPRLAITSEIINTAFFLKIREAELTTNILNRQTTLSVARAHSVHEINESIYALFLPDKVTSPLNSLKKLSKHYRSYLPTQGEIFCNEVDTFIVQTIVQTVQKIAETLPGISLLPENSIHKLFRNFLVPVASGRISLKSMRDKIIRLHDDILELVQKNPRLALLNPEYILKGLPSNYYAPDNFVNFIITADLSEKEFNDAADFIKNLLRENIALAPAQDIAFELLHQLKLNPRLAYAPVATQITQQVAQARLSAGDNHDVTLSFTKQLTTALIAQILSAETGNIPWDIVLKKSQFIREEYRNLEERLVSEKAKAFKIPADEYFLLVITRGVESSRDMLPRMSTKTNRQKTGDTGQSLVFSAI